MRDMNGCCEIVSDLPARQRRVLQVVLAINAAMFLVEFVAGLLAHSTALLADSVDMLGDAIVYGFSLYVVGRGAVWQGRARSSRARSWPRSASACSSKSPSRSRAASSPPSS
jgi:Co/Zn/Cd efflux system component